MVKFLITFPELTQIYIYFFGRSTLAPHISNAQFSRLSARKHQIYWKYLKFSLGILVSRLIGPFNSIWNSFIIHCPPREKKPYRRLFVWCRLFLPHSNHFFGRLLENYLKTMCKILDRKFEALKTITRKQHHHSSIEIIQNLYMVVNFQ